MGETHNATFDTNGGTATFYYSIGDCQGEKDITFNRDDSGMLNWVLTDNPEPEEGYWYYKHDTANKSLTVTFPACTDGLSRTVLFNPVINLTGCTNHIIQIYQEACVCADVYSEIHWIKHIENGGIAAETVVGYVVPPSESEKTCPILDKLLLTPIDNPELSDILIHVRVDADGNVITIDTVGENDDQKIRKCTYEVSYNGNPCGNCTPLIQDGKEACDCDHAMNIIKFVRRSFPYGGTSGEQLMFASGHTFCGKLRLKNGSAPTDTIFELLPNSETLPEIEDKYILSSGDTNGNFIFKATVKQGAYKSNGLNLFLYDENDNLIFGGCDALGLIYRANGVDCSVYCRDYYDWQDCYYNAYKTIYVEKFGPWWADEGGKFDQNEYLYWTFGDTPEVCTIKEIDGEQVYYTKFYLFTVNGELPPIATYGVTIPINSLEYTDPCLYYHFQYDKMYVKMESSFDIIGEEGDFYTSSINFYDGRGTFMFKPVNGMPVTEDVVTRITITRVVDVITGMTDTDGDGVDDTKIIETCWPCLDYKNIIEIGFKDTIDCDSIRNMALGTFQKQIIFDRYGREYEIPLQLPASAPYEGGAGNDVCTRYKFTINGTDISSAVFETVELRCDWYWYLYIKVREGQPEEIIEGPNNWGIDLTLPDGTVCHNLYSISAVPDETCCQNDTFEVECNIYSVPFVSLASNFCADDVEIIYAEKTDTGGGSMTVDYDNKLLLFDPPAFNTYHNANYDVYVKLTKQNGQRLICEEKFIKINQWSCDDQPTPPPECMCYNLNFVKNDTYFDDRYIGSFNSNAGRIVAGHVDNIPSGAQYECLSLTANSNDKSVVTVSLEPNGNIVNVVINVGTNTEREDKHVSVDIYLEPNCQAASIGVNVHPA